MRTDVIALDAEIKKRAAIRDQLLQMCPELAEDDAELLDMLENETNVTDIIVAMARTSKEREAAEKACKELAKVYTERADRHKMAYTSLRRSIIQAMTSIGQGKIKHPLASISVRSLEDKVELIDKDATFAPDDFCSERVVREFDMAKINADLDKAVELGLVVIHNDRQSVTIKV